ncbi:hypothetical protein L204_101565 [Cryptococcus depauperatus]
MQSSRRQVKVDLINTYLVIFAHFGSKRLNIESKLTRLDKESNNLPLYIMWERLEAGNTPLPVAQITVLMAIRLAEPISYTVIFPFINQMVEELGVTDSHDQIGFYSGLVESVFAFAEFFAVYYWAKLSDKIGRKPVLLFGLVGIAITGPLFGLARSLWTMILFRSLCGALNGNVAVIKAAIGDITDESNSTEAFAMYGLAWTVGSMVGNALGGVLSHPYERFPEWFGSLEMFKIYPYLLPCLVCTGLTVLGISCTVLYFKESLPGFESPRSVFRFPLHINTTLSHLSISLSSPLSRTHTHRRNESLEFMESDLETSVALEDMREERLSEGRMNRNFSKGRSTNEWDLWKLMRLRKVKIMVWNVFLNAFMQSTWNAAVLLFFFDRHHGLAMSPAAIGTAMALNGIWTVMCQILLLTPIRHWLGVTRAYQVLSAGYPFVWCFLPMLRLVLTATESPLPSDTKHGLHVDHLVVYPETRAWPTTICVNLYLVFTSFVGLSGSLTMVLVNNVSPDKTALGAINGICTAAGCMARVLGPSLVSTLFAMSMDRQIMGGKLWWISMVGMSLVNSAVCTMVKSEKQAYPIPLDDVMEEERETLLEPANRLPE